MMIFKYFIYLVCFTFSLTLYADVSTNYVEKDAKVISDNPASQSVLSVQANNGSTGKHSINKSSEELVLYAEQWELARSGESLLSSPVLKKVISAWLQDKDKVIEIRYPGGEEGELWVQELMSWLVSLGIPSGQMSALPGSGADDVIKFALIK